MLFLPSLAQLPAQWIILDPSIRVYSNKNLYPPSLFLHNVDRGSVLVCFQKEKRKTSLQLHAPRAKQYRYVHHWTLHIWECLWVGLVSRFYIQALWIELLQ